MVITNDNKIAVIGLGCYYPGARNVKDFWQNILSKRQQFRNMPNCRLPLQEYYHPEKTNPDKTYGKKAALTDGFEFDWKKHKINKTAYDSTDIVHWLALDTAMKALEDSGLDIESMPKYKTGVIIGNSLTGEFTRSETMRLRWPFIKKVFKQTAQKFNWDPDKINEFEVEMELLYKSVFADMTEDSLAGGLANTIAGRICNFYDFHGGGYTVDGACSSSLLAIITAANALSAGDMDIAISGGVDISLDTFELVGFSRAGALTNKEMKVYDKNRSGFIPGEGCGMVVLKRLEDAKRDKDKIYSVIDGWGISSDGKGGITAPRADGQSFSLIRAYEKANISPEKLHFIEGHGTGTRVGDTTELQAIKRTFDHFQVKNTSKTCAMTSAKSIIGHAKAAAGIAAFIKTTIALNQRITPPTAGVDIPHEFFQSENSALYPALKAKKYPSDTIMHAGISAMGFGGINSHVTLSSGDKPDDKFKTELDEDQLSASVQNSEVFVFSANTKEELIKEVKIIQEYALGISICELADLAKFNNEEIDQNKTYKCAVVAMNTDDLYFLLNEVISYLNINEIESGHIFKHKDLLLWIGNKAKKPKIAFTFPGQGSQRINSAYFLIQRFDWAKQLANRLDNICQNDFGFSILEKTFIDLEKANNSEEIKEWNRSLTNTQIAQPAIILSSILWLTFLEKLGIKSEISGGHSLGELTSLYKSGAYNIDELFRITILRGSIMGQAKTKGQMVSLSCDEEIAEVIISKIKDVQIANINSPEQTIISGTKEGIEGVIKKSQEKNIPTQLLPVTNAFHSKLMDESAKEFNKKLEINKKFKVESKFFSSVLVGEKSNLEFDIKDYLTKQITSPVKFVDMINNITKKANYIIEIGPASVLSRLTNKINDNVTCISTEGLVGDFTNLNSLIGNLFVGNIDINFKYLYKNRLTYPFIEPSKKQFITNPLEKPLDVSKHQEVTFSNVEIEFNGDTKIINKSKTEKKHYKASDIEQLLVDLVADKTGFDKESITLDNKILDDLNLDSIKSAELVGKAVRELKIDVSEINATLFSNASLQELADALKNAPRDQDVDPETKKKTINWLRYFTIKEFKEKLPKNLNCQILKEETISFISLEEFSWANEFFRKIQTLNIKTNYSNLNDLNNLTSFNSNHAILIIPKINPSSKNISISSRVKLLSKLNTLPFGNLKSLNVIHFDNEIQSLFASIHHEYKGLKVRVFNVNRSLSQDRLIGIINHELKSDDNFINARYTKTEKYISRPVLSAKNSMVKRNIRWMKKDVIVITAGAKGITKECTLKWATDSKIKSKLVLLGRSSSDNKEVQQALADFKKEGIESYYYCCDIVDKCSVEETLKAINDNLGDVTGLIHGAGLNVPRLFQKVTYEEALAEIAPKVIGIRNILHFLDVNNLKIISAISSIIGYTGMPGNAWYAWENEMMERMLKNYQTNYPELQICILGYSVWDEVGMGARMGSVDQLANMGIDAISKQQGIDSFVNLMDNRLENNVCIIASRLGSLDSWNRKIPKKPKASRFLSDIKYFEPQIELVSQNHLTLETDLYLKDHDFQGSFLFPTVFGLEAMAQAVAYAVGVQEFELPLQIQDIKLEKPIIADLKEGVKIQIKVLIGDNNNINVGISTEETDFKEDYFSAKFILDKIDLPKVKVFKKPQHALNINPKEDLYGGLLFQGESFQKLKTVNSLSDDEVIYEIDNRSKSKAFFKKLSQKFILGDPFCRDVLLQSVQLCVPHRQFLPIGIDKITLKTHVLRKTNTTAKTHLVEKIEDKDLKNNITVTSKEGKILEYLEGYKLKSVGQVKRPGLNAKYIIDPSLYDESNLNNNLQEFANNHQLVIPVIKLEYIDNIISHDKQVRHEIEKPVLNSAIRQLFFKDKKESIDCNIEWHENGKPYVSSDNTSEDDILPRISLAHDSKICLCVAGFYEQGCDIEPVKQRDEKEWEGILYDNVGLWKDLRNLKDKDIAGTLVWSIFESVKKTGIVNLEDKCHFSIITSDDKNFLFNVSVGNQELLVFANIFDGVRPPKRVFSCVVQTQKSNTKSYGGLYEGVISKSQITPSIKPIKELISYTKRGPSNEEIYVHRFRVGFKETNDIDGSIHYSSYSAWMGKLRELPLQPIARDLVRDLVSEKWGIATNSSYIKIVGNAKVMDLIEGHCWMGKPYGKCNSTSDVSYAWYKVNDDNSLEPIAYSFLPTTWVKVTGHGLIEPDPFPDYFQKWVDGIVSTKHDNKSYLKEIQEKPEPYDVGEVILKNNIVTKSRKVMHRASFKTSRDESNLVGNVFYANYYRWQSKTFDQFIYKADSSIYHSSKSDKKIICLESSVQHLREAMPFDTIESRLYIDDIYKNGLLLYYEFFRIDEHDSFTKLAWGHQKVVFTEEAHDRYEVTSIPEAILDYIGHKKALVGIG